MPGLYFDALVRMVIEHSKASTWRLAVREWDVVGCEEDPARRRKCICGHESPVLRFTIKNRVTGSVLSPVSAECLGRFGKEGIADDVDCWRRSFALMHLAERREDAPAQSVDLRLLDAKLLRFLYDRGAFRPTGTDGFRSYNDYAFLVEMLGRRYISSADQARVDSIVHDQIRPFLKAFASAVELRREPAGERPLGASKARTAPFSRISRWSRARNSVK